MRDDNLYYIITLELGIAILDPNKNVIYFNKFIDPINSHEKIKEKDYDEIVQNIQNVEIFEKYQNIKILTNFPEIINLIKNKNFEAIEKIPHIN